MRSIRLKRIFLQFSIIALSLVHYGIDSASASGSLSDIKDVCSISASPAALKVINATALLVANDPSLISFNSSTNTYSISTTAFTERNGYPICSTSRFYGEEHISGNRARTAFMVGQDMMMTAAHGANFDAFHWKVVFRHSKVTGDSSDCTNFTWQNIPASDVYSPVALVTNTYALSPTGRYDYAVIKLDRPVVGRRPLKIRRSGNARIGDTLISAGYPFRGEEKIDTDGIMAYLNYEGGDQDNFHLQYPGNDIPYNLHGTDGSSGSPIYNVDDDVVEQVVAYSSNMSWSWTEDNCVVAAQDDEYKDTNGQVAHVQDQIPRGEVLVSPLDLVVHRKRLTGFGGSGGSGSLDTKNYSIETAHPGVGNETVVIGNVQGPTGPSSDVPKLTSTASGPFFLPAAGMNFSLISDDRSVTKCGSSEFQVNVRDVTNDMNNYIRHRFDIGVKEVEIDPPGGWTIRELGAPYPTKTYTVKNMQPEPTSIVVEESVNGSVPFMTIDGLAAAKTVSLSPAGTVGDTVQIIVGVNPAADNLMAANVQYHPSIKFRHVDENCAVSTQKGKFRIIDILLSKGSERFLSSFNDSPMSPPAGGSVFGPPLVFDLDLSGEQNWCVYDIDLNVAFLERVTAARDIVQDLKIMLEAPSGHVATLWNRNAAPDEPSPYWVREKFPELGYDKDFISLHLDESLAPPLGPDSLSSFLMDGIKGHWKVTLMRGGQSDTILPIVAKMNFRRTFSGFCN